MKVYHCDQLSPEWWSYRRGIPTASEFNKIITPSKGDLSKSADKYINELIADVICLRPDYFTVKARPISQAMQNGVDMEPEARAWYESENNCDAERIGFLTTDDGHFGCSPDGVIWEQKRGLELKCPNLDTHLGYLLEGVLPLEYKWQVHGGLVVAKGALTSWDFMSYAPGAPPFVLTVTWDEETDKLKRALDQFHVRYMETLDKIRAMKGGKT